MGLETLERTIGRGVGVAGGIVAGYNAWAHRSAKARAGRLPEGGTEQSILPFYAALPELVEAAGVVTWVSSGGMAKQALADPYTEWDLDKEVPEYVVTNPNSDTIKKATLFRAGELTLRDMDCRFLEILVGGDVVDADAIFANDGDKDQNIPSTQKKITREIQAGLDEVATGLHTPMPRGPEVSGFMYEEAFGSFSPTHYATRTTYDRETNMETMFASTGQKLVTERGKLWNFRVALPGQEEIVTPVNQPIEHMMRTDNRPVVPRDRDQADVNLAEHTIKAKGLYDEVLGAEWEEAKRFRAELDLALSMEEARKLYTKGDRFGAVNMILARYVLAPFAPRIEASEIAAVIRDPDTRLGQWAASKMGA